MSSAKRANAAGQSVSQYIDHHLHHLRQRVTSKGLLDFSVIHFDTLFFSLLCAAIVLSSCCGWPRARRRPVCPGKFQTAVEMLVEMVNDQANALVRATRATSPRSR